MKIAYAILTSVIAISFSGCIIGNKPAAVVTPAAPQPAPPPPAPPAAAPQPLSLPQTTVQLPPEQPFDLDSVTVVRNTAEVHPEPPVPPRKGAAKPTKPAATPVTVTPPEAPPTPPAAAAAADAAPPGQERAEVVRQVLSHAEEVRLKGNAQAQRKMVNDWVTARKGRLDNNDPTVVKITSLIRMSEEAEGKGDMRQASELADRAAGFLKELQSGR